MRNLLSSLIPLFLFIGGCDAVDEPTGRSDDAPVQVEDLAVQAGLELDELTVLAPDSEALEQFASPAAEGAYCQPYDFQECRNTCGIVGQACFVCVIADDGFPVFYCTSKKPIVW